MPSQLVATKRVAVLVSPEFDTPKRPTSFKASGSTRISGLELPVPTVR
jgi:hypothetical protein